MKRLILLACLLACTLAAQAAEVMVFAAASLTDILREAAPRFEAGSGHRVRFNFGGSGMLVRQILEGAPADVFISADELRMDLLERRGELMEGTRAPVAGNELVVIVPALDGMLVNGLDDLDSAQVRRIAIGETATVPAGAYARGYLERSGHWNRLQKKLVPLPNVRAVLAAVGAGNAEAGFVYATDAALSADVRVVLSVSPEFVPIRYPAAVLRDARDPEDARAFVAFLRSAEAQAVFAKFGFLPAN